jgi:transcriptional regulator of arginine metabolism
MVYCLPPELGMPTAKSPLKQLVLDIVHNNVMVIIRTSPGAAQLIARLLDSLSKKDGVLGTIAGDDTIFIAPADVSRIEELRQRVEDLFENV